MTSSSSGDFRVGFRGGGGSRWITRGSDREPLSLVGPRLGRLHLGPRSQGSAALSADMLSVASSVAGQPGSADEATDQLALSLLQDHPPRRPPQELAVWDQSLESLFDRAEEVAKQDTAGRTAAALVLEDVLTT